jgi:serine/threonine protein kinase
MSTLIPPALTLSRLLSPKVKNLNHYRHANLVQLMGASVDGPWYCIVYELMPGGSLYDRLVQGYKARIKSEDTNQISAKQKDPISTDEMGGGGSSSEVLTWEHRLRIAVDAARGLEHLHHGTPPTIHRDVKSMNILLDMDGTAKVSAGPVNGGPKRTTVVLNYR